MATLKDVQTKISAVKKTKQITKAMNMVAASRLRGARCATAVSSTLCLPLHLSSCLESRRLRSRQGVSSWGLQRVPDHLLRRLNSLSINQLSRSATGFGGRESGG